MINRLTKYLKIISVIIVTSVFISSCVKDKITGITDNSVYTPEFALPLGSHDFSLKDSPLIHLLPIDPLGYPDTLDYLSYDSAFVNFVPYVFLTSEDQFQFSAITDKTQYITALTLRTNIINGIPGEITMQFYFLAADHSIIDSVFSGEDEGKIQAATVNPDRSVTETEMQTSNTTLSNTIIQNLSQVYYIRSVAKITTEGFKKSGINYYANQHFWAQIGIQVKLELPLNEL